MKLLFGHTYVCSVAAQVIRGNSIVTIEAMEPIN